MQIQQVHRNSSLSKDGARITVVGTGSSAGVKKAKLRSKSVSDI